ncbi:TRAM domain-containing protein [Limibacillus sp. MBR-115]|jgi:23S rRNA (uracil1939-C5)-methyltransferase|uniref:class I SAM-dependent RNA methyltransferase n=1 Tax=Limibacillus sp. MBR-115 TaxID=3156465 RepID=UPI00339B1BC1
MRRQVRPGGGKQAELTVTGLGGRGDGLANFEGRPVFLPGALPGERVLARLTSPKAGGFRGEILELIQPSPDRVEAECPHFGSCGGCSLQHFSDEAYRQWKGGLAAEALARRGVEAKSVSPLQSVPARSRRRATLAARRQGQKVLLGFREQLSHRIVDVQSCMILRPALFDLLAPLRILLADILPNDEQMDLHLLESETGCDLLIRAPFAPGLREREALASFAREQDLAQLSWEEDDGPEPVALRRQPIVTFGKVAVQPWPGAFLQATAEGESLLRQAVFDFLPDGARKVADLFSGCGAFTFSLAEKVSVLAVEGEEAAVATLDAAARRSGLSGGVSTACRDLARDPLRAEELEQFDAIVLDPPRNGAPEQCAEIAQSNVQNVTMLSCNPSTFARDVKILVDNGFALTTLRPIDQFLWTGHLEIAASLQR